MMTARRAGLHILTLIFPFPATQALVNAWPPSFRVVVYPLLNQSS